jgi:hypothetical protein
VFHVICIPLFSSKIYLLYKSLDAENLIDNNATTPNTTYQYVIQTASANICSLGSLDSCSITTAQDSTVCGGYLWGVDMVTDTGDEALGCSTSYVARFCIKQLFVILCGFGMANNCFIITRLIFTKHKLLI